MAGKGQIECLVLRKQRDRIIGIDSAIENRKCTGSNERVEAIGIPINQPIDFGLTQECQVITGMNRSLKNCVLVRAQ